MVSPMTTHPITLAAQPPLVREIFVRMAKAGARHFALFGGAIRDADYNARHGENRRIMDYDIRIWTNPRQDEGNTVLRLEREFQSAARHEPSAGTGRIRYCFDFMGSELDISLRLIPAQYAGGLVSISAVAQDRAGDSDIGICAVAIDPTFGVWARPEYIEDQMNRTLSVYPIPDAARKAAYSARMKAKFPAHAVIEMTA